MSAAVTTGCHRYSCIVNCYGRTVYGGKTCLDCLKIKPLHHKDDFTRLQDFNEFDNSCFTSNWYLFEFPMALGRSL
jgi:hypothetical protein